MMCFFCQSSHYFLIQGVSCQSFKGFLRIVPPFMIDGGGTKVQMGGGRGTSIFGLGGTGLQGDRGQGKGPPLPHNCRLLSTFDLNEKVFIRIVTIRSKKCFFPL